MSDVSPAARRWTVSPDLGFQLDERRVRAAFGRTGLIAERDKREGDGATPIGCYALREAYYRPDRLAAPETALTLHEIRPEDGWCDDPRDPAYNRPVRRPYPASHEKMWREDELYDLVVVLGHNDAPPAPLAGSAIFLHCKHGDDQPTEGCVAIAREDLIDFLARARPGDVLEIRAG